MYQTLTKPIFDIVLSLLALPLLLGTLLIIAPVIFFTDKGPIFYNSNRMGKNGKRFTMLKFRSMQVNAPDLRNPDGSTYNSENDQRTTTIGRFIRKTSIDELPQLINVLRGDMSLVGPRPILYSDRYSTFNDTIKKRLTVKPGITGYTQAYFRNSICQEEKFKHDAWYVDNMSFRRDLQIIFKTFFVVLTRDKVYRV
ncbi:MAG: sugar transferase [Deltaproteobacteria bacterium]|nr:sugar transferase [Deltaproteobacteria bacterium]